jgi:hypothetical protein
MTKRVPFLLPMVLFIVTFAACHGPLLGIVTETYVNQNNVKQTLELTTKETVKGFVAGRSPNLQGSYTLLNDQKVSSGRYTRDGNTYVLKSNETEELKVVLQADSSLRDESGNIWRLESRSRSFRPPDQDLASQ